MVIQISRDKTTFEFLLNNTNLSGIFSIFIIKLTSKGFKKFQQDMK